MQMESGDDALNFFMEFITMTNMSMENVTTLCSAPLLDVFGLGSKDTLKKTCIHD